MPRKWVFRDKTKDYGIDGEVELFDTNKTPQGLVFWAQLKSTESKEEYLNLFQKEFRTISIENCYNSIEPRKDKEFFIQISN